LCTIHFPLLAYGTSVPLVPPSMTGASAERDATGPLSGTAVGAGPSRGARSRGKKKKVNNALRNAWRADYKTTHGLVPSFDTISRVLVSAKCRFCISFGREVDVNGALAPPNPSSSGGAPSATSSTAPSAAASSSVSK
jgi:hypothetical protein